MKALKALDAKLTMSSLEIAEVAGKRHDNVMTDIEKMLAALGSDAPKFSGTYKTGRNNTYKLYNLPQRETLILVSGYSAQLRANIIDRWQELEKNLLIEDKRIADRQAARLEAPLMCEARSNARKIEGKEVKSHLFMTEYNMINVIVLGSTSKDYAKEHGLKPTDPIRDIMRPVEIEAISGLQNANTNFIDAGIEYQERKAMLKSLFDRKYKAAIIEEIIRIES